MTTYIDPISLLPPRFGEIYSDRNILLSGQASWGGIATPLLTTQGVSILVTPKGGGALSVCLLPNQTYALPVDGYTVWVKLNRSPGVHTLLFGTDVLIYDNVSIPTPSQDWLPAFTRFNDKCYAHGGFVIPSILTQIGLAKNSDYEIVVGSATDPRTTYTSLAQAVQDAQSGWSILVLSGTYSFAAPAQGGIDAQSALAWTGKTLYITGEGHSTVIQNTGSLTRAFGIQNSTGSIVKNITLQNFPQAVRFDASSDSILELWQAVAAGYTDPTYINASQNNQVNLNIESAGLSPSSQVRKYIIGGSSYYLDASGNFVFTGVGNFTGSSVTFSAATPVFVKSLSGTQNAVVTDASNQLRSLLYGDFNAPLALVQRDSIGRFSAFNAQFSALSINQAVVTDGFGYLASLAYRVGESGVDQFNAGDTGANTLVKRGPDGTVNAWNVLVYNTLFAPGDSYINPYSNPSSLDYIYGYTTAEFQLVKAIAVNDLANQLQIDHIKSHTGASGSDTNPPTGNKVYWSWDNPHTGYLTPWVDITPEVSLWTGNIHCNGVYRGHTGSEISNFGAQIQTRSNDSISFDYTTSSSPGCTPSDPFEQIGSIKFLINDATKFEVVEVLGGPDLTMGCPFSQDYIVIKTNNRTLNLTLSGGPTTSKSFIIDHPLDADKYLIHACIEGPTVDVYYRGEARLSDGAATVTLPSYFEALTKKENRTVTLTCIGGWSKLWVEGEVTDGMLTVRGDVPSQRFYWEVKAERGSIEVEPRKSDIEVFGDGPYRYYKVS